MHVQLRLRLNFVHRVGPRLIGYKRREVFKYCVNGDILFKEDASFSSVKGYGGR